VITDPTVYTITWSFGNSKTVKQRSSFCESAMGSFWKNDDISESPRLPDELNPVQTNNDDSATD
jgi:hypothetical protein